MPRVKSKYSTVQNQELAVETLIILTDSKEPLTISEICGRSILLSSQTTQKMARVLNDLVEMGMVLKASSKRKKRMVYLAASQMAAEGAE